MADARGRRRRGGGDGAAPEVPDLVFTANAGLVNGGQFVPSHFRHPERQPETPINADWFAEPRLAGRPAARGARPRGRRRRPAVHARGRADRAAVRLLVPLRRRRRHRSGDAAGCPVRPVQLVDPRLYHLDLTFCPLDGRRAIVAPLGWDAYGRKVVEALVPEPLVLTDEEALSFCANSVVVGTTIVMPAAPPRVGRQLEAWGFDGGRVPDRRVPQGRRRLPLPDAGPGRGAGGPTLRRHRTRRSRRARAVHRRPAGLPPGQDGQDHRHHGPAPCGPPRSRRRGRRGRCGRRAPPRRRSTMPPAPPPPAGTGWPGAPPQRRQHRHGQQR